MNRVILCFVAVALMLFAFSTPAVQVRAETMLPSIEGQIAATGCPGGQCDLCPCRDSCTVGRSVLSEKVAAVHCDRCTSAIKPLRTITNSVRRFARNRPHRLLTMKHRLRCSRL